VNTLYISKIQKGIMISAMINNMKVTILFLILYQLGMSSLW